MSAIDASELLRPGLLQGVSVLIAGARASRATRTLAESVSLACAGLGARVSECTVGGDGFVFPIEDLDDAAVEQLVVRALTDGREVDLLAVDGAGVFAAVAEAAQAAEVELGTRAALRVCMDVSWNVTRAVANLAFLPNGRGGRVVYLAPAGSGGEHASAALAGLENLARTLSIEWARHGVTAVAIAPGTHSAAAREVAALTAYLASPAGAYFSGCLLDLRGP